MGVDTQIYLPAYAGVDEITRAIGILVGLPKEQKHLDNSKMYYVNVPDIECQNNPSVVGLVDIKFKSPLFGDHQVLLHLDLTGIHAGEKLLMPRATSFWIALGTRLIQFFGGSLDYNDCDVIETNLIIRKRAVDFDNDNQWWKFQQALWNLNPMTMAEVDEMKKHASY